MCFHGMYVLPLAHLQVVDACPSAGGGCFPLLPAPICLPACLAPPTMCRAQCWRAGSCHSWWSCLTGSVLFLWIKSSPWLRLLQLQWLQGYSATFSSSQFIKRNCRTGDYVQYMVGHASCGLQCAELLQQYFHTVLACCPNSMLLRIETCCCCCCCAGSLGFANRGWGTWQMFLLTRLPPNGMNKFISIVCNKIQLSLISENS